MTFMEQKPEALKTEEGYEIVDSLQFATDPGYRADILRRAQRGETFVLARDTNQGEEYIATIGPPPRKEG